MRKGMISSIVIILSLIVSSGCVIIDHGDGDVEVTEEKEVREMTAREEEVFRSYGLTEERIAKMKKEGLNYSEQSFVDTAIMMLDYLTEKYNEEFVVVGGDIPDILSQEYFILAKAVTGDYQDIQFEVTYYGKAGYSDGYLGLVKGDEVNKFLQKKIDEIYGDTTIFTAIEGDYVGNVTMESSEKQVMKELKFFSFVLISDALMSQKEYEKRAKEIKVLLSNYEMSAEVRVFCVNNKVDKTLEIDDISTLIFDFNGPKDNVVWHGQDFWTDYE